MSFSVSIFPNSTIICSIIIIPYYTCAICGVILNIARLIRQMIGRSRIPPRLDARLSYDIYDVRKITQLRLHAIKTIKVRILNISKNRLAIALALILRKQFQYHKFSFNIRRFLVLDSHNSFINTLYNMQKLTIDM